MQPGLCKKGGTGWWEQRFGIGRGGPWTPGDRPQCCTEISCRRRVSLESGAWPFCHWICKVMDTAVCAAVCVQRRRVTSEEQAAETHHGTFFSAKPIAQLPTVCDGICWVQGRISVWVCWAGQVTAQLCWDHSRVGRGLKAPRMGHRADRAGIQVAALIQFFQRRNLNCLAVEGWEIGIPQG